jgi:pyruvate formate lyase activating enzyme
VDLKAFSEDFYRRLCSAQLGAVKDTLRYIARETAVWLEITTLLIPGENDSDAEIDAMTQWIAEEVGIEVPLHFTAFHPDYRMTGIPATSAASLRKARATALRNGLRHVYTGNVRDEEGQSTRCHACGATLIGRDWYTLTAWGLDASGHCASCGAACAGRFDPQPGNWGARREPIRLL